MKYFLLFFFTFQVAVAQSSFIPVQFKANFQQVYKSISGKVKKRSGSISYKYPGNIRLEMAASPVKTIFVSNARTSWYYTAPFMEGEKGDVVISNSGDKEFVQIFDTLKKGLVNNSKYKVEVKQDQAEINFTAKTARLLEVKKTTIKFKSSKGKQFKDIEWIQFFYTNKKPVKMIFSGLSINPNFSGNTFIFQPPKNTNISRE